MKDERTGGPILCCVDGSGGGWRALDYLARRGEAAEAILALAKERGAAEIAVGRRRSRVAAALLGSVSARTAAEASCPITIVPEG